MKEYSWRQKLVAECVGTALLVLIGAGAVTATLKLNGGKLGMADLGMIAFAFAFIIAANIFAIGKVSGCHINPAITLALAATGRFPWRSVGPYLVAQYAGATVGGFLIWAIFQPAAATMNLGLTTYAPGAPLQGFLAEALGTFILMLCVMGSAVDSRAPAGWGALAIGLIVAGVVITLGPASGQAINPARYFGSFINQFWFGGKVLWEQLPIYTVAPVVGTLSAAVLYDYLNDKNLVNGTQAVPVAEPVRELIPAEAAGRTR
jgi:glycerol uptake facilitator protein